MGVKDGYSFERVYRKYLAWFREKAVSEAKPKDKKAMIGYHLCHEDVYKNDTILLNRMYFVVPLLPSESRSGRLELFVMEELNLMETTDRSNPDSFDQVIPVEYTSRILR